MSGRRNLIWLGLTPNPNGAARHRRGPADRRAADGKRPAEATAAERRRVVRLILHGTQHGWLRYLAEVTDLVTAVADSDRPGGRRAALRAAEVVLDHHRMLIGLPGPGYDRTAADRSALERAVRTLRTTPPDGDRG
ncbi:hypothetical protein O1L68_38345 [Streptomyces lydicus]|nr:hypothetical protein [Streptomyces lydicus]